MGYNFGSGCSRSIAGWYHLTAVSVALRLISRPACFPDDHRRKDSVTLIIVVLLNVLS